MRSSVFAIALLAASVVASPILKIRDTETDVVYVTQTFYVTAGQGHHKHQRTRFRAKTSPPAIVTETPTPQPVPAPEAPAPEPEAPAPEAPAPAPSAEAAPGPVPSPVAYVPGNDYISRAVNSHNVHRANHSAGAVSWDTELASIAAQIAASCKFEHDTSTGGGGFGQNIAAGTPPENVAKVVSDQWYNSEVALFTQYGIASPDMGDFHAWGHFSQVVWKDTDRIGCATQQCSGGVSGVPSNVPPYFTVCNYRNTGNVIGYFDKNVLPSSGQGTVTG
ncbi:MAG: hypothetical protein M1839_009244 [Geoglossum umbratile]|nr:MAG: hypothetical protein M1839_009244 [Geoglossum umbratile]